MSVVLDADDRADEACEAMLEALAAGGYSAADVVYALGMMIAHAVRYNAVDKRPEKTLEQIKGIVELELRRPR